MILLLKLETEEANLIFQGIEFDCKEAAFKRDFNMILI